MSTKYRDRQRLNGHLNGSQKQQTNPKTSDNPYGIKTRFGNNQPNNPTSNPTSILKKNKPDKPYVDRFNESVTGWRQPDDLELFPSKPAYSPIGTPPRLRALITPPGLEPYRNTYNLRRLTSPLPSLDDWYTPPAGLDAWGLDPLDYRLGQDLHLIRRYPSPLTHYGLPANNNRQKKSYIVVPRLSNIITPPISRDGANYSLPSRRALVTNTIPDPQYSYLERIRSHHPTQFQKEPSDYVYVRRNEAFANRFIDEFIGKCIEDQFIPDLLLEVIGELDRENKQQKQPTHRPEVDRYFSELNQQAAQPDIDRAHLFSDEWIRELDYQRPYIPSSNIDSNPTLLRPLDFRQLPPERKTTQQPRFQDLPSDTKRNLLSDLNQELIDFEVQNMVTEITGQTINNKLRNVPVVNNATTGIYNEVESEVIREIVRDTADEEMKNQHGQVDQVQFNAVQRQAENKLLDTFLLDRMIGKYIKQNGSVVDVDDLSRFLDVTILENIIYQYRTITNARSRTLDNYALRKFHLNAFMNMTLDLLLTELSASLIEDMKDLDEHERRSF